MKKIIDVSMAITFDGTEDEFLDIQRILDHHIEYLMSLDEFPEIKSVSTNISNIYDLE